MKHPIDLQHKITSGPDLVVSYKAEMVDDSGNTVGYAYAFEEGQTPPQDEPNAAPWIGVSLADPRPNPWGIFAYSSPPVKVGQGSIGFSFTLVDIKQDTINLKSKDKWIAANIQLPKGYDVNDIKAETVLLNDAISTGWDRISTSFWGRVNSSTWDRISTSAWGKNSQGSGWVKDPDSDGGTNSVWGRIGASAWGKNPQGSIWDRVNASGWIKGSIMTVKFDARDVKETLSPGTYNLKISGELTDGTQFQLYSQPVKVIDSGK